jgi:hypothetical protein
LSAELESFGEFKRLLRPRAIAGCGLVDALGSARFFSDDGADRVVTDGDAIGSTAETCVGCGAETTDSTAVRETVSFFEFAITARHAITAEVATTMTAIPVFVTSAVVVDDAIAIGGLGSLGGSTLMFKADNSPYSILRSICRPTRRRDSRGSDLLSR